jgi:hypothetical protein
MATPREANEKDEWGSLKRLHAKLVALHDVIERLGLQISVCWGGGPVSVL